jgi:hypothetical protein
MSEMKSAFERAMEKAEKIGKASAEELLRFESIPLGNKMAARFLQEPGYDFEVDLIKYKGTGKRKYVIEGAVEIFLRHVALPRNELSIETALRAKEGFMAVKESKKEVETIFDQLKNLFKYYKQARQETFNQVKQAFEQQVGQQMNAMGAAMGPQMKSDVTAQQQFVEEWHRVSAELDLRYEQALGEQKQRLLELP